MRIRILLGMLTMVLVFGMMVVGCDNNLNSGKTDPALNGTWVMDEMPVCITEMRYNNGYYEQYRQEFGYHTFSGLISKGNYTTKDNVIYCTNVQVNGAYWAPLDAYSGLESKWYSIEEANNVISSSNNKFFNDPMTYLVSGNTLTLTFRYSQIWTRK